MIGFVKFIIKGYTIPYEELKKYEKNKLPNDIESLIKEMKEDYNSMDVKSKRMIEYKLKDAITEIDKFSLMSLFFTLYLNLFPKVFELLSGEELGNIAWVCVIGSMFIIVTRCINVMTRLYRIFNLYLNVINEIKNDSKNYNNIKNTEEDEETKKFIVTIKEVQEL